MTTPERTRARRRLLLLSASGPVLLAAVTAVTAGSPPGDEAPQAVRDAWIDGRLETTYALNPHLGEFDIDTHVQNGVVRLGGAVKSEIDRDLAESIASGIDGVVDVQSLVTVDPGAGMARHAETPDPTRTFTRWIEDVTATARVKTNLLANGSTRGLAIDVDTADAVVTLSGRVASSRERLLAEMIARNTDGIISVKNRLEVPERS